MPPLRRAAWLLSALLPCALPAGAAAATLSDAQVQRLEDQGLQRIVVAREPGLTADERGRLRADADVTHVVNLRLPDTEVVRAAPGELTEALDALNADPDVRYAEPDLPVRVATNDPLFGNLWGLQNTGQTGGTPGADIGAVAAWAQSTGAGQTVAVVDTGVTFGHPDLQSALATNPGETGTDALGRDKATNGVDDDLDGYVDDARGWDFTTGDNDPTDQHGHGTHVAGTIAATADNGTGIVGVAPAAKVLPLRVLQADGTGFSSWIADAFDFAGDHGIPIVNASLGGPGVATVEADAMARHPDTLYVVAAGNDGADNDTTPVYPCDAPGGNVLCVGASDATDARAWFSNFGATTVDLFAPGVGIVSTMKPGGSCPSNCYASMDGTSMATPHVAGAAALVRARDVGLSATQIKEVLMSTVDSRPALSGRAVTGGRLDAAAAVASVGAPAAPANVSAPTFAGSAVVGGTLTRTGDGRWSGAPTSFAYRWQRCASDLSGCTDVGTGTSYQPVVADAGKVLRLGVTATNAFGSATAWSAPSAPVVQAPVNRSPPTIDGSAVVGATLRLTSLGQWDGTSPSYTTAWQRCSVDLARCVTVGTQSAYVVADADAGSVLRVAITATNAAGSATARSATTAVVAAAAAVAPPTTTSLLAMPALTPGRSTTPTATAARLGAITLSRPSSRVLVVRFSLTARATVALRVDRRVGRRWVRSAVARTLKANAGTVHVRLTLRAAGRALPRGAYRVVAAVAGASARTARFTLR